MQKYLRSNVLSITRNVTIVVFIALLALLVGSTIAPSTVHASGPNPPHRVRPNSTCKTNGKALLTSAVSGSGKTVGHVSLWWSQTCGTNWTVFTPSPPPDGAFYGHEDVYLYSQGGGSLHTGCYGANGNGNGQNGVICQTDSLYLGNIAAQSVATAAMSAYPSPDYSTYGKVSQY